MRGIARLLMPLVLGLGVLVGLGYFVVSRTTSAWFDKDLRLRGRLAISAARPSLQRAWTTPGPLSELLTDLTRDERIMAAEACDASGGSLGVSSTMPAELGCAQLGVAALAEAVARGAYEATRALRSGRVRILIEPLISAQPEAGTVTVVQDLSYLDQRAETTRWFLLLAFLVLAVASVGVTVIAARVAWRGWNADFRGALAGTPSRQFRPLLRDVRLLLMQQSADRREGIRQGYWDAAQLRATLRNHLEGQPVIVLANREPYIHERRDGEIKVLHPASGLVTALEPVMRACSGVWIAHGSGSADREVVDAHDRVDVPPGNPEYALRRVWLSDDEEAGYYYGFANEGLWPLCHVAHTRPTFRPDDWRHYVAVNQRFAEAVCAEATTDDPIVLVQDYHFALAPRLIRARLPRATILTFWHIPWPSAERIGICPWREELIDGLLGSSILGFHTKQHCNNFVETVDTFMESRIDREAQVVVQGHHRTAIRPYPISIDWPLRDLATVPSVATCRAEVRAELGLAPDALLGVGVDRLDYTKGIEERFAAIDATLARHPEYRGRLTFVQLAAPSRSKLDSYRELNERVEVITAQINARWGRGDYRPIILRQAHHDQATVLRYFRAAEFCYVSSLHDGMNLVAKEFVAARDDDQGVLVLSQFTGAARELTEALIVNPYDLGRASAAIDAALRMPRAEARDRMRAMRQVVAEFNVYRWAGRILLDAVELRRRERIVGRYGVRAWR